jgi:FAD-dependent urate hydroxylase
MTVARLSDRVRRDLAYLSYPSREWTVPHYRDDRPVLDVLIVGGGQAGLATAFGLKLERVNNVRIVDRNPRGLEGPWRRFARMRQLRTPKEVTGIDFGLPSLTIQAWYEAKFGARAWKRISAIPPEEWRDYLDWYRDVLALPVENNTEVTSIEPAGDLLLAHLRRRGRSERVIARKIVLATGIDGSGAWRAPPALVADLPRERWAHSSDKIDFRRLRGKRVGVLGAGANAFDNAAVALEAGAASVDLCLRRTELPRVNPLIWTNFAGMLGHFAELDDLYRWRFMRYILEKPPMPPPQEAFWRCRKFDHFAWHADCRWRAVRYDGKVATVETNGDPFTFDFIIFATGFATDLSARPELAPIVRHIALWRDRFTPPPGEESDLLSRHPYLGPAFEFTEREPGRCALSWSAAQIHLRSDAQCRPDRRRNHRNKIRRATARQRPGAGFVSGRCRTSLSRSPRLLRPGTGIPGSSARMDRSPCLRSHGRRSPGRSSRSCPRRQASRKRTGARGYERSAESRFTETRSDAPGRGALAKQDRCHNA